MITATITRDTNGELFIEPPNLWALKARAGRRSLAANIRGRKVDVFVGMNQELWYFNSEREASYYDELPGQRVVASKPADCVKWIRSHSPRGPDQQSMLDYYIWLDFEHYWQLRTEQSAKDLAAWEQEQEQARSIWYARQEELLRQQDIDQTENGATAEITAEFPVEIEPDVEFNVESNTGVNYED